MTYKKKLQKWLNTEMGWGQTTVLIVILMLVGYALETLSLYFTTILS